MTTTTRRRATMTWPALAALGLVLAGCGGGEPASDEPAEATAETTPAETVELPEGADPAAQVSENYADCLSALGTTGEPVYTPGPARAACPWARSSSPRRA